MCLVCRTLRHKGIAFFAIDLGRKKLSFESLDFLPGWTEDMSVGVNAHMRAALPRVRVAARSVSTPLSASVLQVLAQLPYGQFVAKNATNLPKSTCAATGC
jgi:hypothetical protein